MTLIDFLMAIVPVGVVFLVLGCVIRPKYDNFKESLLDMWRKHEQ